jgi:hypothetical protein
MANLRQKLFGFSVVMGRQKLFGFRVVCGLASVVKVKAALIGNNTASTKSVFE